MKRTGTVLAPMAAQSIELEGKMRLANRKLLAALTAAAFMITANVFEASAQRSRMDDWLGFDQSGDSGDQRAGDYGSARDTEVQPERGFPTLAKENVTAT